MNKFKVGDRVRILPNFEHNHGCAGYGGYVGQVGTIHAESRLEHENNLHIYVVFDDIPGGQHGCYSYDQLELVRSAKPSSQRPVVPKFLLRYKLDSDPVEEFSTLPEVKARIKTLLSNRSLKRDSIKVYELKGVLNVTIQDLIVMKSVTITKPKAASKSRSGRTRKAKQAA